jgi:hypothetical protein
MGLSNMLKVVIAHMTIVMGVLLYPDQAIASNGLTPDQLITVTQFTDELAKVVDTVPTPPATGGGRNKVYNYSDPTYNQAFQAWKSKNDKFMGTFPVKVKTVTALCKIAQNAGCDDACGKLDRAITQATANKDFNWTTLFAGGHKT